MSYFMQNGDVFTPTPGREAMLDTLPVGNYIIIETMSGLMFQRTDPFEAPGRMYGDITKRAERILSTFQDRPRTTGVLLSGEKGSGKSQLARNIAHAGYGLGLPTIIVNAPYCGDAFNALLATIEQPAIILMDEFEKVYSDNDRQEAVLTLLDGMMTTKKLFVLTVNDRYRVNDHMKNRPGRIFYSIEFQGLDAKFIREYCEENLKDTKKTDGVLRASALFRAFNFDMLKAMVEEMNRYDETAFEVMQILNARPTSRDDDGVAFDAVALSPNGVESNKGIMAALPMSSSNGRAHVHFSFANPVPGKTFESSGDAVDMLFHELGLDRDEWDDDERLPEEFTRSFMLETNHLKAIDPEAGKYEFEVDGFKIFVKRREVVQQGYAHLIY